jgi:hypothetical protein
MEHAPRTPWELFSRIVNDDNINIPLAVWYSTPSDRTQREMLRAAVNAFGALNTKKRPTAKDDIKWLLNQCDQLADRRNDALHAPLVISGSRKTIEILPYYFFGNPRALKLKDKNILDQVGWYRATAETLRGYALSLWFHLGQQDSWPEKPLTPTLGQNLIHKK